MILMLIAAALIAVYVYRLYRRARALKAGVGRAQSVLTEQRARLFELIPVSLQLAQQQGTVDPETERQITELQVEIAQEERDAPLAGSHPMFARLYVRLEQQLLQRLRELFTGEYNAEAQAHLRSINELDARLTACRRALRASVLAHNRACEGLLSGLLARALGYTALAVPATADEDEALHIQGHKPRAELPQPVQLRIAELETMRQRHCWQVGILLAVAAVLAVVLLFTGLMGAAAPLGLVLIAGTLALAIRRLNRYRGALRQTVLPLMARAIDGSLHYNESGSVDTGTFNRSGLYSNADRVRGRHLFYGTVGQTRLEFSFVHAEEQRRERHRSKNGHTQYRWKRRTLFRGLLLVADFNKHIKARTLVRRDGGGAAGDAQMQPVPVEDEAFNEHFTVLSTDLVEAHYLLDREFMERLKRLRERLGPLELSLREGRLFLACRPDEDMLEPTLRQPMAAQLARLWLAVQSLAGIVEDLDLNTRIWSKGAATEPTHIAPIP